MKVTKLGLATSALNLGNGEKIVVDLINGKLKINLANGQEKKLQLNDKLSSLHIYDFIASNIKTNDSLPVISNYSNTSININLVHLQLIGEILLEVNSLFKDIVGQLNIDTEQVRLWPHHFDLAFNWYSGKGEQDEAEMIYNGFSFGDESIKQPYFATYMYPWPNDYIPNYELPITYQEKPWKGLVLNYKDVDSAVQLQDFFYSAQEDFKRQFQS